MGCCSCIFGCVKGGIDCVAKAVLMSLNGFFAATGLTLTVVMTIALIIADGLGISSGFLISALCVGVTILITSFLGCCGACFKNKCMLIIYIALLVCLIISQIVLVSMAGGEKDKIVGDLEDKFNKYDPELSNTTEKIDNYQKDNECCGVHGIADWANNTVLNAKGSVPDSCCVEDSWSLDCGQGYFTNPNFNNATVYTEGCFGDSTNLWGEIVWGIMIFVIIIQGVLVFMAGCLTCKVGGDKKN